MCKKTKINACVDLPAFVLLLHPPPGCFWLVAVEAEAVAGALFSVSGGATVNLEYSFCRGEQQQRSQAT